MTFATPITIAHVSFDHHHSGFGIETSRPSISWSFDGKAVDWEQESYDIELRMVGQASNSSAENVRVFSNECTASIDVPWPGKDLVSGDEATVRVRSRGKGIETPWSKPYRVEVGLLEQADWTCALIETPFDVGATETHPPALFRRSFYVKDKPCKARLYITAHGVYNAEINGSEVSDHVLAPGWTVYDHELQYQIHDVYHLLRPGTDNAIGAHVAEGWYCGRLGFAGGRHNIWGSRLGVIAQLVIRYEDDTVDTITSDLAWTCSPSPIEKAGIYDGETYNMLKRQPGWSCGDFHDGNWSKVKLCQHDAKRLKCSDKPPVRVTQTLKAVQMTESRNGNPILDFGQNLVGVVRFKIPTGPPGHQIGLLHAEVLEGGECVTRTLRHAKAIDNLILATASGREDVYWQPSFTFHGFRYVEVVNWPDDQPQLSDFVAMVIHSDMKRTGQLACSDPLINRLEENVVWSMRGNFVDIPTDCPQRDERLGYTGDIQVFAPTASFLYDCYGVLKSWLRNLVAEQKMGGNYTPPIFSPKVMPIPNFPLAVWGDAIILVPWDLYWAYGHVDILSSQFDSMVDWIDHGIPRAASGLWGPVRVQLGDWLDPLAPPDRPHLGMTDAQLVADAYLVRITDVMAQVCTVLGHTTKASSYQTQAVKLRAAFAAEYITQSGRLVSDSQTAYALAIQYDLFPNSDQKDHAVQRLEHLVLFRSRCKISTGFVGTPLIGHALSKVGKDPLFYMMLINTKPPSWLYAVTMGATTVWERWDSVLTDGTINPGEMTSLNHYALGSVADWIHIHLGGLCSLLPGWKKFRIAPKPGGGIDKATITFRSPYGKIRVDWRIQGEQLLAEADVPPNSTAEVHLGTSFFQTVGSGSHKFQVKWARPDRLSLPPPLPFTTEDDDPKLL